MQCRWFPISEVAVFFDWGSLYQHPRTDEETTVFKDALKDVNLWYAHEQTTCLLMTKVPEGVVSYERRGWPVFERAVSVFVKNGNQVLDLGNLDDACDDWLGVLETCTSRSAPPTAPECFNTILLTKKFTNDADVEFVQGKYAKTFNDVIAPIKTLVFERMGWGPTEMSVLVVTLPLCPELRVLNLAGNEFGVEGATMLAHAIPKIPKLGSLDLASCRLGDAAVIKIFEAAIESPMIFELFIDVNNITAAGFETIAKMCPRIQRLVAFWATHNAAGEDGAEAIASMLKDCKFLLVLVISDNRIPNTSQDKIRNAWLAAGKVAVGLGL